MRQVLVSAILLITIGLEDSMSYSNRLSLAVINSPGGRGVVEISPAGAPGGTDGITNHLWYSDGQEVTLLAVPIEGWFYGWNGGIDPPRLVVVMTTNRSVTAAFGPFVSDWDADGLPDSWESSFRLSFTNSGGVHGPTGDPDNDGLDNMTEFNISYLWSNQASYYIASPINADSDYDGMHDGFEFDDAVLASAASPTNGAQQWGRAVVDPNGENGPGGNWDSDTWWDADTGTMTSNPISNYAEYVGADGILPGEWPLVLVSDINAVVYRYSSRPADSGDSTSPYRADSDGDVMPDGWELAYGMQAHTHDWQSDADSDGQPDYAEYIADTSPTNDASFLAISQIRKVTGSVILNWHGGSAVTQYLEATSELAGTATVWSARHTNTPPTALSGAFTNTTPSDQTHFYRIRAVR